MPQRLLPPAHPRGVLETRLLQEEPAEAGGTAEKDPVLVIGATSLALPVPAQSGADLCSVGRQAAFHTPRSELTLRITRNSSAAARGDRTRPALPAHPAWAEASFPGSALVGQTPARGTLPTLPTASSPCLRPPAGTRSASGWHQRPTASGASSV